MAQDFRNSLVRTIGTGDTIILTAGDYDAVIGIRCCNILTATIKVDPHCCSIASTCTLLIKLLPPFL